MARESEGGENRFPGDLVPRERQADVSGLARHGGNGAEKDCATAIRSANARYEKERRTLRLQLLLMTDIDRPEDTVEVGLIRGVVAEIQTFNVNVSSLLDRRTEDTHTQ